MVYIGGIITGLLHRILWKLIKYVFKKLLDYIRKRRAGNQEREDLEGGLGEIQRDFSQRQQRDTLALVERNWLKRHIKIGLGKIGHKIMNLGYPPKLRHVPTAGEVALAEHLARRNTPNNPPEEETSFINPNHHLYESIKDLTQPQPSTSGFKPSTKTTSNPSPSSSSSQTYMNPLYCSPQNDSTSSAPATATVSSSPTLTVTFDKGPAPVKKTTFRKRPENPSTIRKSSRISKPPKKYDPSDPSCGIA